MHLAYFTEQPYAAWDEKEARADPEGVTSLMYSNRYFDVSAGARLHRERLVEYKYAEDVGFDGIMLNEHHNAPFCMQPRINMTAAMLAAITERVKIVLLGNPLPVVGNVLQLAEELGMIDMTSNGRLVSGYVRGAGTEQYANNVNPAYNRERFEEAHDLLIKLWTTPGPFRWEGKHYQYRVVNPWSLPVQKPHPRIWIPGVGSTETIVWAAKHRYPYIGLNTKLDMTVKIWETYDEAAREVGYQAGPEQHGYLLKVHVSDSMEKAERNAREFMWMHGSGHFTGLGHPVWVSPPGYDSASSRRMRLTMKFQQPTFEEDVAEYNTIYGTPDKVVRDLRHLVEKVRPGILILWGNDGRVSHEDSMTCIRLMGEEVLPAVREHGKELGLKDPFELNTPVSLAETPEQDLAGVAAG